MKDRFDDLLARIEAVRDVSDGFSQADRKIDSKRAALVDAAVEDTVSFILREFPAPVSEDDHRAIQDLMCGRRTLELADAKDESDAVICVLAVKLLITKMKVVYDARYVPSLHRFREKYVTAILSPVT